MWVAFLLQGSERVTSGVLIIGDIIAVAANIYVLWAK